MAAVIALVVVGLVAAPPASVTSVSVVTGMGSFANVALGR